MAGMRNLNNGSFKDLERRIRKLETNTMLGSASIGEGRVRFYDNSILLIENGALDVTGSARISGLLDVTGRAEISGILDVSGHTTLSGDTTIAGPTGITGKLTVQGDSTFSGKLDATGAMSTKGTLSVEGKTTLKNDLELTSGGKIKAGNVTISPDAGGKIALLTGHITADSFGLKLASPTGIEINSPGTKLSGLPSKAATANLHIDAFGQLWRAT